MIPFSCLGRPAAPAPFQPSPELAAAGLEFWSSQLGFLVKEAGFPVMRINQICWRGHDRFGAVLTWGR